MAGRCGAVVRWWGGEVVGLNSGHGLLMLLLLLRPLPLLLPSLLPLLGNGHSRPGVQTTGAAIAITRPLDHSTTRPLSPLPH